MRTALLIETYPVFIRTCYQAWASGLMLKQGGGQPALGPAPECFGPRCLGPSRLGYCLGRPRVCPPGIKMPCIWLRSEAGGLGRGLDSKLLRYEDATESEEG